jgi:hypothetical protein
MGGNWGWLGKIDKDRIILYEKGASRKTKGICEAAAEEKSMKPPITQRTFVNAWGELDYICKKIRYWLYASKQKPRAARYLERLEHVLAELPENDSAIIKEEGFALLYELKGELREAITHREREIRLMQRLHKEAQSPHYQNSTRAYMLRGRDRAALAARQTILESLRKK